MEHPCGEQDLALLCRVFDLRDVEFSSRGEGSSYISRYTGNEARRAIERSISEP